jgi:hypothetical protein
MIVFAVPAKAQCWSGLGKRSVKVGLAAFEKRRHPCYLQLYPETLLRCEELNVRPGPRSAAESTTPALSAKLKISQEESQAEKLDIS